MTILIEDMQNKLQVNKSILDLIEEVVKLCLKLENFSTPTEVSILLVDNDKIMEINSEHRGIDKPTDVLSFPMADIFEGELTSPQGDMNMDENVLLLGDIVISLEKATEQSEIYGHSFERELAFLTAHGMLHLLGYDHEEPTQEKCMFEKQENLLLQLGLNRE